MRIGEFARRAGVGIDTVRYYERKGVLPRPIRQGTGDYRQYNADDLARLSFIRRAKSLGFTLSEITELLSLSSQRGADMASMREAANAKLVTVNDKLGELERIRQGLETLVDACPGHGEMHSCPIVAALTKERTDEP